MDQRWMAEFSVYHVSKRPNLFYAELDRMGKFMSSDGFYVLASDFGPGIRRRLTVDYDGNLRISSFHKSDGTWKVSWEALIYFARQDLISFILLLIRRRVTIGTPFWLELTRGFASRKKDQNY